MSKREFLMLASTYKPGRHYIAEWFASEKLDGMRIWWDGGISRGIEKALVPWANTSKDSRYVDTPYATGLWTRYGNVIHAPAWWLDKLPRISLDGELYREGHRQFLMSTVKSLVPGDGWNKVNFHIFDMPTFDSVTQSGTISNPNAYQYWSQEALRVFKKKMSYSWDYEGSPNSPFQTRVKVMERLLSEMYEPVVVHPQSRLPTIGKEAEVAVDSLLEGVVDSGGEGLIIRAPASKWKPHRMKDMLKVKPFDDMEVKVVGYITGKGKHLGRMGSLIVESSYGRFAVGGFTDEERRLKDRSFATQNPGVEVFDRTVHFEPGDIITIKHRGFSSDNIPQEARYWRARTEL